VVSLDYVSALYTFNSYSLHLFCKYSVSLNYSHIYKCAKCWFTFLWD